MGHAWCEGPSPASMTLLNIKTTPAKWILNKPLLCTVRLAYTNVVAYYIKKNVYKLFVITYWEIINSMSYFWLGIYYWKKWEISNVYKKHKNNRNIFKI